jgi:hypothetical protein
LSVNYILYHYLGGENIGLIKWHHLLPHSLLKTKYEIILFNV